MAKNIKSIVVKVYFNTEDLKPKHAWGKGSVAIEANEIHQIHPKRTIPFNSLMEIPSKIEKVLRENDIKVHRTGETDYIV